MKNPSSGAGNAQLSSLKSVDSALSMRYLVWFILIVFYQFEKSDYFNSTLTTLIVPSNSNGRRSS